jgi:hypothetical protein
MSNRRIKTGSINSELPFKYSERSSVDGLALRTPRGVHCACFDPLASVQSIRMKRFTETTKWADEWFQDLSPLAKCLWIYLCDNCDNAGVIQFNSKLAAFQIGSEITQNHFNELKDRITKLPNGRIWVKKFVEFQFGSLTGTSVIHRSVIRLVQLHGLPIPYSSHENPIQIKGSSHMEKTPDKERIGNGIGTAEKISRERELERITKELGTLGKASDYAEGSFKHNRVKELNQRQRELREKLGVVA